jgi:hypothetical protein
MYTDINSALSPHIFSSHIPSNALTTGTAIKLIRSLFLALFAHFQQYCPFLMIILNNPHFDKIHIPSVVFFHK